MSQERQLSVTVTQDEDGTFIAKVHEFPGCFAGGPTVDEAMSTLLQVIPAYLEDVEGVADLRITNVVPVDDPGEDDSPAVAHRHLALA